MDGSTDISPLSFFSLSSSLVNLTFGLKNVNIEAVYRVVNLSNFFVQLLPIKHIFFKKMLLANMAMDSGFPPRGE